MRVRSVVSKQWFDQEYGAMFTTIAGAIYDEWDSRVHVRPHEYQAQWANYLAFDYGFANPFVCLDIQVGPDDTVYVWREYYASYLSTQEHALYLRDQDNPRSYTVQGLWGDPRGPDEAATISRVLGYVQAVPLPWKTGIETIKRMLKKDGGGKAHLYVDPSCTNLIRQMEQLHIREQGWKAQTLNEFTGDRNMQHKTDDHAADALRYFIGPYFALGAGSHLADIYGQDYVGSESHDFLTYHGSMTLSDNVFTTARRF
jgi:phage terminase large subunit